MKLQPIKLIKTLNKHEINQLQKTKNRWVETFFSQHESIKNCTHTTSTQRTYIIDENKNFVLSKRRNEQGYMKTAQLGSLLVSIINNNHQSGKVVTLFADTLDRIPEILRKQFFPFLKKMKQDISIDFQRVATTDGSIETENIILTSSKGKGFISKNKISAVAKVTDTQDNTLYMGSIHISNSRNYEDMKKDVFSTLI